MQANLVIVSESQAGKKITTTVSYINPDALNSKLKSLAIALTNLTKNEYISASRSTKNDNVENPDPSSEDKTEPTLIVSSDGLGIVTYNGDGTLSAQFDDTVVFCNIHEGTGSQAGITMIYWNTGNGSYDPETHWTGTLFASEGEIYAAKSVRFEVYS